MIYLTAALTTITIYCALHWLDLWLDNRELRRQLNSLHQTIVDNVRVGDHGAYFMDEEEQAFEQELDDEATKH
jgi:hypothetical protein